MQNSVMAAQGELDSYLSGAHAEMADFERQTYWNKFNAEIAGLMAGAVVSVFVTGPQLDSVRERINSHSYDPAPPAKLGEAVLAFSPMLALPVVTGAAYTLYRRRKYRQELEDKVTHRIVKPDFDFGEEFDK